MINLPVKIREKTKIIGEKETIPAILYGPEIKKPIKIKIDYKIFEKIYKEAGESSLISIQFESDDKKQKSFSVLIYDIQKDRLTGRIIHADFYQPRLKEEMIASIPIIFEGEAPAVKQTGGTFVKNISEIEVKALPSELPKEIRVNIEKIKTLEDYILVKDLIVPKNVKILKEPEEIVALVTPKENIEEELEKPIEEKVEEVEKIEEKEEKEEGSK